MDAGTEGRPLYFPHPPMRPGGNTMEGKREQFAKRPCMRASAASTLYALDYDGEGQPFWISHLREEN